jgi:peptidoglycan hydrolase-like protein with peptidoglycan-binding domain
MEHSTGWLQEQLNALGADPPLLVDGSYGRATRRAVAAFQAKRKLAIDGLAGPQTIGEIEGLS